MVLIALAFSLYRCRVFTRVLTEVVMLGIVQTLRLDSTSLPYVRPRLGLIVLAHSNSVSLGFIVLKKVHATQTCGSLGDTLFVTV